MSDQTPEEIQREIDERLSKAKKRHDKPTRISLIEIASAKSGERPEAREALRQIAIAFDNRAFLPQLRDVRRFLERIGQSKVIFKSREAAGPKLMDALSMLPIEELVEISRQASSPHESDFSILSRAILGRDPLP